MLVGKSISDIHWLVDIVGPPDAGKVMVAQLRRSALKGKPLKLRMRGDGGKVGVKVLDPASETAEESPEANA